jgi:pyruvate/2-oxoglutarate dehydrogenase complex dihydrolipoamide dehydrogenase (E3) component
MPWIESRGIELVRGPARLEAARRVQVGERVLIARSAVVLAVGSGALFPPIPGLAEAAAWSNREVTTAREVPESLVVLGGGVAGVEMAQAWASLGSRVSVVEALDRLLSREEPIAGEQVRQALEAEGITVRTGSKATAVKDRPQAPYRGPGPRECGIAAGQVRRGRRPPPGTCRVRRG